MPVLIVFLISSVVFAEPSLHFLLAGFAIQLQTLCVESLPAHDHLALTAATVCGQPLSGVSLSEPFRATGLLHLLVVSGSHLLFLERLVSVVFPRRQVLTGILLVFFTLGTGLQPPCVRALTQWLLQRFVMNRKWHWGPVQTTAMSGIAVLLFFPEWVSSTSFLLSWACSFALCAASETSALLRQCFLYLFLFPFLLPLSAPGPFSIFTNLALSPVFGLLLFPLSLAALIFPLLSPVIDSAWSYFSLLLAALSGVSPQAPNLRITQSLLWSFLIGAHLIAHFRFVLRRRREI